MFRYFINEIPEVNRKHATAKIDTARWWAMEYLKDHPQEWGVKIWKYDDNAYGTYLEGSVLRGNGRKFRWCAANNPKEVDKTINPSGTLRKVAKKKTMHPFGL